MNLSEGTQADTHHLGYNNFEPSSVGDLMSASKTDCIEFTFTDYNKEAIDRSNVLKPMIVHQQHAPEWQVDNQYILHGYRVDFINKKDLFKSLFMRHNELLNIWTHLIGGIIFLILIVYISFYFDIFSTVYNKIGSLFSQQKIDSLKDSVPELLKTLEYNKLT